MLRKRTFAAIYLIVLTTIIATWSNGISQTKYDFVNKLIDSSTNSYSYGYAPSIIYDNGIFHMFFCSSGIDTAHMDFIRYAYSSDGRIWSEPKVVLKVSDDQNERAACDPSIVYYNAGDGPYYYLFYSGNKKDVETVMLVARSENITGEFKKFTERGTWDSDPEDPKIIIYPRHSAPTGWYGAGQQVVVVKNGVLYSWYHDDTAYFPEHRGKIFFSSTTNPVDWPTAQETNVENNSVDVKYDPVTDKFIMFEIFPNHNVAAYLTRRFSKDGLIWSAPEILCDKNCYVDYSHNLGVSGDKEGRLISTAALIVYGAPYDLNPNYQNDFDPDTKEHCVDQLGIDHTPYCWGHWDLYGSVINAAGKVWNDIPWGWEWEGMSDAHDLALGDYDGDGKTDRAIVHRPTGEWYVIASTTGNPPSDIPWGWKWDGMSEAHDLALGDYDGDGKTDRAIVHRATGEWYVIASSTGNPPPDIPWGWKWEGMNAAHDLALGDYDGDGKTDRAIVHRATGEWYVIASSTGNPPSDIPWGWKWEGMYETHDLALGDYDGDGKTDRAIVHKPTGEWYIIASSTGNPPSDIPWGWKWEGMYEAHDLALSDYDGDGKTDRAIIHKPTGEWYVIASSTGNPPSDIPWGWKWEDMYEAHDLALGDYDGDGKIDRAIVHRPTGEWYVLGSILFQIYGGNPTSISEKENKVANEYDLAQSYPNPFNPETTIRFSLSKSTQVKISIFNIQGEIIRVIADGYYNNGLHSVAWDGRNQNGQYVASGTYLYKLEAGKFSTSRKLVLLR